MPTSRAAKDFVYKVLGKAKYHLGGGEYGERMSKKSSPEMKELAGHPIKSAKFLYKTLKNRFK